MRRCLFCGASHTATNWRCPGCGEEPPRRDGFPLFAPDLADAGEAVQYQCEALVWAEHGHFWFRARRKLLRWAFATYLPQSGRFLEIGCGSGSILSALAEERPGLELTASELRVDWLAGVRERVPNTELVQMDACKIPFRDHFDGIGAFDVLEHLENDDAALAEIHAALRPGGLLMLTVPQHRWLWSAVDEYSGHYRRYTAAELGERLHKAGFENLRMTSFVTFLVPLLLVSRWAARGQRHPNPTRELRVPGSIDRAFDKLMALERSLIRAGFRLPVGGSLLALSRRSHANLTT